MLVGDVLVKSLCCSSELSLAACSRLLCTHRVGLTSTLDRGVRSARMPVIGRHSCCMSCRRRWRKAGVGSAFVKMSACCCAVGTHLSRTCPLSTVSVMK